MSKNMKSLSSLLIIVVLLAAFTFGLGSINGITAPIIESNSSAALFEPLFEVIPEAQGFDVLYDVNDPDSAVIADVPASVTGVYQETSGLGYALTLSNSGGYTGDAIVMTMAIDAEGKVSNLIINQYPETKNVGEDYPASYIGNDSTLANVSLVSGCTYSSSAIKLSVEEGFAALINNNLIGAGVKSDAQILTEIMAQVYPGIANNEGILQTEEVTAEGSAQQIFKNLNGSGFAFIMDTGDGSVLAVANTMGSAKVVDTEGNDVTEQYSALAEEALSYTNANATFQPDKEQTKLSRLISEAEPVFTAVTPGDIYSSITAAYEISAGGNTYYGLVSRSYGYGNIPMAVYYVMDTNGTILAMTADEFIFHAEYFDGYELDEASYKAGFTGLTAETWTGEQAFVSGATMTTNGVKTATTDALAAFPVILANMGGETA